MQQGVDRANEAFWNEPCGTTLAARQGVQGASPEALARYDAAYLAFYPYLLEHVQPERMAGCSVLEIGVGYGTVAARVAAAGAAYCAIDLSDRPLGLVRARLPRVASGLGALRGTAAALPFANESFDYVVSIGCLHHTGDLAQAIREVHRVLKPGGATIVMLYNRFWYRNWLRSPLRTAGALWRQLNGAILPEPATAAERRMYDVNSKGEAAPETVLVSKTAVRRLFGQYAAVTIQTENCDDILPGGRLLSLRQRLLSSLGRRAGLDLYITARK